MLKNSDAFNSGILTAKARQLCAQELSWVILGSILGSLGAPFGAQLGSFFQVWFQGGSQGGFWIHFRVFLGVVREGFLRSSGCILGVLWQDAVLFFLCKL